MNKLDEQVPRHKQRRCGTDQRRLTRKIIKTSKFVPVHVAVRTLPETHAEFCPVRSLLDLNDSDPSKEVDAPLFRVNNAPLTYSWYRKTLLACITAAGITDARRFGTHSFRIGAATCAYHQGIPESIICLLGRWRSLAVRGYNRGVMMSATSCAASLLCAVPRQLDVRGQSVLNFMCKL